MAEKIKGLQLVDEDFTQRRCDRCEYLEYSPRYIIGKDGVPMISRMQAHCLVSNKEIYAMVHGCLEFKERIETEGV